MTPAARRASLLTVANPSTADCQASWSSTSAAATSYLARMRSMSPRTMRRLSFRLCASGICRTTWRRPTFIGEAPAAGGATSRSERTGDLLDGVRLDHVAFLDVVEALEADAALEALLHLARVVL